VKSVYTCGYAGWLLAHPIVFAAVQAVHCRVLQSESLLTLVHGHQVSVVRLFRVLAPEVQKSKSKMAVWQSRYWHEISFEFLNSVAPNDVSNSQN